MGDLRYADAGVDIDAGNRAVDLIRRAVASTHTPAVLGGIGAFSGLFELDTTRWRKPVLSMLQPALRCFRPSPISNSELATYWQIIREATIHEL